MYYLACFFTGAFLCNAIPHLASGLQGRAFPTPFATPRGVGNSSPLINTLWGFLNLLAGLVLLSKFPAPVSLTPEFAAVCAGALILGIHLSRHFGKVRRD